MQTSIENYQLQAEQNAWHRKKGCKKRAILQNFMQIFMRIFVTKAGKLGCKIFINLIYVYILYFCSRLRFFYYMMVYYYSENIIENIITLKTVIVLQSCESNMVNAYTFHTWCNMSFHFPHLSFILYIIENFLFIFSTLINGTSIKT